MTWFKRQSGELDTSGEKKVRTEGLWVKCDECRQIIWKKDLEENANVCPKCDHHMRLSARSRLEVFLDPDSGREETVTKAAPAAGVVGEARFELARLATPAPKADASAVPPLARGCVDGAMLRRSLRQRHDQPRFDQPA